MNQSLNPRKIVVNSGSTLVDPAGVVQIMDAMFLQTWDPSGVFTRIAQFGQRQMTPEGGNNYINWLSTRADASIIRHEIEFAVGMPTNTLN
jgi:hypothetical protein